MQNDILVTHGVDPLAVQMIRNPLNSSRINVVHFLKQKSCRTAVALCRASTSFLRGKDVNGRDQPGHDEEHDAIFPESGWIATISKPRFRIKINMGHM